MKNGGKEKRGKKKKRKMTRKAKIFFEISVCNKMILA